MRSGGEQRQRAGRADFLSKVGGSRGQLSNGQPARCVRAGRDTERSGPALWPKEPLR